MVSERGVHTFSFISILFGFALAKYFEAWSAIVAIPRLAAMWTPASIVTATMTILLVEFWWASFEFLETSGDSFKGFLFSIGETMMFYLMGSALVDMFGARVAAGPFTDVGAIYLARRGVVYWPCIVFLALVIIEMGAENNRLANLLRIAGIVVCIAALGSSSLSLHYWITSAGLALALVFTGLTVSRGHRRTPPAVSRSARRR